MPLVRSALIATAACLIGAAAYAQPASTDTAPPAGDQSMPQSPPPAASPDMNAGQPGQAGPDMNAPPANAGAPPSGPADTGSAANTSANVTTDANGTQVIASQPVPDTPANRAQSGKPMSRAGKRTAPAGN